MSDFKVSFSLEGQVVVVTGAAQGIGQGVAVAAAGRRGGRRRPRPRRGRAGGDGRARWRRRAAGRWRSASTSATATRSSPRSIASSPSWGGVDGLVNCAAVISENVPVEEADRGRPRPPLAGERQGRPLLRPGGVPRHAARGSGSIVNLASQAALLSLPNQVVYTATKGAVAAMTRSQAIDWAPHGIRVNAIAPTFVWTPMAEPMLKIQQVHDAVGAQHPARPHRAAARHRRRGRVPLHGRRVAHHRATCSRSTAAGPRASRVSTSRPSAAVGGAARGRGGHHRDAQDDQRHAPEDDRLGGVARARPRPRRRPPGARNCHALARVAGMRRSAVK